MLLRFTVKDLHPRSGAAKGVFTALYELEDAGSLAEYEIAWFHSEDDWFTKNLSRPPRDLPESAVYWFKASASEHVRRMRALAELLRHKDVIVDEAKSRRPGIVVYEDDHQVGIVPFGAYRRNRAT